MATDISKLGLKAKWQDLTEGMVIAGSGTSKDFMTGEWTHVMELSQINVSSVCYAHRSVRTAAFRSRI